MNVIKIPDCLERQVFSESVKFFDSARLIGIIDDKIGMKIPIKRACNVAYPFGTTEGMKPRSSLKSELQMPYVHGKDRKNPKITDGTTKRDA